MSEAVTIINKKKKNEKVTDAEEYRTVMTSMLKSKSYYKGCAQNGGDAAGAAAAGAARANGDHG